MNILQPLDRLGRFKKIILWIVGIVVAYTILGFLILPFTIKLIAVKKLSEILNRPVAIESVRLNPYALSLTVNKMQIQEQKQTADFVAFNTLYANLSSLSIFKLAPVIQELKLDGLLSGRCGSRTIPSISPTLSRQSRLRQNRPRLRLQPRRC